MGEALSFSVVGVPAPQGSKRHVGNGVMVESSKRVKPWRQDVKHAALDAVEATGWTAPDRGATVSVMFFLPRPRGHYGTGRNAGAVKASAPAFPSVKPDLDKLLRSTLDALTEAGVVRDDAQVHELVSRKRYADTRPAGAMVEVTAG